MKSITLLFITILLTACGGNSQQASNFYVVSQLPEDAAKSIEPDFTISVTLNENVLESTINKNNFTLINSSGKKVDATISYNPVTQQAELKPAIRLHLLDTYTVNVLSSIESVSGENLKEESWTFTVRDGKWGKEKVITTAKDQNFPSGSQAQVDIDFYGFRTLRLSDGILVMFTTEEGDNNYFTINEFGESSQPEILPEHVSEILVRSSIQSKFISDDKGNATLIYRYLDISRSDIDESITDVETSIRAIHYDKDQGWGNPQVIISESEVESEFGTTLGHFNATSDGKGNIFVEAGVGIVEVLTNRYTLGSGWGEVIPLNISDTIIFSGEEDLQSAIDATGNTIFVWLESNSLWSKRYVVGSGWEASEKIISTTQWDGNLQNIKFELVGFEKSIMLVWTDVDTTWAKRYEASGSGWTSAELLYENSEDKRLYITQLKEPKNSMIIIWGGSSYKFFDEVYGWGKLKENAKDLSTVLYNDGWAVLAKPPSNDQEYFVSDDDRGNYFTYGQNAAVDSIGNGVSIRSTEISGLKSVITARRYTKINGWSAPIEIPVENNADAVSPVRSAPRFIVDEQTGRMALIWGYQDYSGTYDAADIRVLRFE